MQRLSLLLLAVILLPFCAIAKDYVLPSPDGKTVVTIQTENGKLSYSIRSDSRQVITPSSIGMTFSTRGHFPRV